MKPALSYLLLIIAYLFVLIKKKKKKIFVLYYDTKNDLVFHCKYKPMLS